MANTSVFIPAGTTVITDASLSGDGTLGSPLSVVSGGVVAPGANTQVVFNDSAAFGADSGLTYNKTTDILTSGRLVLSGSGATTILDLTQATDAPYVISLTNTVAGVTTGLYMSDAGDLHLDLAGGLDIESGAGVSIFNRTVTNSESAAGESFSNAFTTFFTASDLAAGDVIGSVAASINYGTGGVASIATAQALTSFIGVAGSGSASNEFVPHLNVLRMDIGTGYTQTAGPTGRLWLADWGVQGPIAVQPNALNGLVIANNNYYNGAAADSPMGAIWVTTGKGHGPAMDATHAAATTYPQAVGIGITGYSGATNTTIGWTTALQIGGSGSPWNETGSLIGTGINISQYATAGINIHAATSVTAPSLTFDTFLQGIEMASAPAAPAANGWRLYSVDNGGKTEVLIVFASGAAQRIAIQP